MLRKRTGLTSEVFFLSDRTEKAAERAERLLIEGFLDGRYPPGSTLPGERDLCKALGIARPALREVLQSLHRDGWLDIQQGKPTRVKDFWREGNVNVLIGLLKVRHSLLRDLVPNLLEMWSLLTPTYTQQAVERKPREVALLTAGFRGLADRAEPYARAMWRLHRLLVECCGNPVYGLVLNSFEDFYRRLACVYYEDPEARAQARDLWEALHTAALTADGAAAARAVETFTRITREGWPLNPASQFNDDEWNGDCTSG